jgi:hypothetical protein
VIGTRKKIATSDLLSSLRALDTSPWRVYEGTGVTDISLASLLAQSGVKLRSIRVKPKGVPHSVSKGYRRQDLVSASAAIVDGDSCETRNPVTPA